MTPDDIKSKLRTLNPQLQERLRINRLYVFGSVARGQAELGSDIDILVDFEGAADFNSFMELQEQLENLLGRPVDLVTRKALRSELRQSIEQEAIRVA